jgi:hypothetical protein
VNYDLVQVMAKWVKTVAAVCPQLAMANIGRQMAAMGAKTTPPAGRSGGGAPGKGGRPAGGAAVRGKL